MSFRIAQPYLLNIIRIINADAKDVLFDRQQQLYYYLAIKWFLIQLLLKGCPSIRRNSLLERLILRRIIAKMPAALYQYALTLVATGQCAAAAQQLPLAIGHGHLPSRALLAHMLSGGRKGVAKDHKRAFKLVEEGTRLGCRHCQGVLAMCYRLGHGCVKADAARSLELARESSKKGSRYGQCVLGKLHDWGLGGVAKDGYQSEQALYRLAAAQNLDEAQCNLGSWCFGDSVYQGDAEGLRLYQLAAAQGYSVALNRIASCHENGSRGVSKNKAEAILWYMRAQEAGSQDAKYALQRLRA